MIEKINDAMIFGYLQFKSFITDFRKDEEAMEVVQVVLLVLVGLLLIVALLAMLNGWLAALWQTITGKTPGSDPGSTFDAGGL